MDSTEQHPNGGTSQTERAAGFPMVVTEVEWPPCTCGRDVCPDSAGVTSVAAQLSARVWEANRRSRSGL